MAFSRVARCRLRETGPPAPTYKQYFAFRLRRQCSQLIRLPAGWRFTIRLLSIQVTQDLPTFGLPVRAQAVIDARNLLDFQSRTNNGDTVLEICPVGRSVRGGISVRF